MMLARERPQPRAGSAAKDHGQDHRRRDAELNQGMLSPEEKLGARAAAPLTEECRIAPMRDKPRQVVRSGAFAHLAHLLREGLGPHELARELARRARLEEQAVPSRLDHL